MTNKQTEAQSLSKVHPIAELITKDFEGYLAGAKMGPTSRQEKFAHLTAPIPSTSEEVK